MPRLYPSCAVHRACETTNTESLVHNPSTARGYHKDALLATSCTCCSWSGPVATMKFLQKQAFAKAVQFYHTVNSNFIIRKQLKIAVIVKMGEGVNIALR